jgi:hypothetical protein
MSTNESQLATAALDTLHGARGRPACGGIGRPEETGQPTGSEGYGTDDAWEPAIETMLSLANEAAWIFEA